MAKRITLKTVNKYAEKYNLELVKGYGYFWFRELNGEQNDIMDNAYCTSINGIFAVNDYTLEQWIREIDYFVANGTTL